MNKGWTVVNAIGNSLDSMMQDPNTAQMISQNSTLQKEVANLISVKNSGGGTTVHDSQTGETIWNPNWSPAVQTQVMKTLLQEGLNSAKSIASASSDIYATVDPLQLNPLNPNRQSTQTATTGTGSSGSSWTSPSGNTYNIPTF